MLPKTYNEAVVLTEDNVQEYGIVYSTNGPGMSYIAAIHKNHVLLAGAGKEPWAVISIDKLVNGTRYDRIYKGNISSDIKNWHGYKSNYNKMVESLINESDEPRAKGFLNN